MQQPALDTTLDSISFKYFSLTEKILLSHQNKLISKEKYVTATICSMTVLEASVSKVLCQKETPFRETASSQELIQKQESLVKAEREHTLT